MTDRRRPMTQLRRALAQGGDRVAGRLKLRAQDIVVDATMLGSVGVGKTTLLASMYERFGHVIGDVDLDVIPRPETSRTLSSYIATLKELPTSIKVTAALPGTASVRHYRFAVGAKGRPAASTLRFTDYPGNYMLPRDYHDRAAVEKALTASD